VDTLRQRLSDLGDDLREQASLRPLASVADIYRDLLGLREEFDQVQSDFEAEELCVTTAPVVLEDFNLGPFEIRLNWSHFDRGPAYRVVALEPYPARTNDSVTHPHVSDEVVCEGDGREAIQAALQQGRIGDFFLLVSQLLHTYAPARPTWNWTIGWALLAPPAARAWTKTIAATALVARTCCAPIVSTTARGVTRVFATAAWSLVPPAEVLLRLLPGGMRAVPSGHL